VRIAHWSAPHRNAGFLTCCFADFQSAGREKSCDLRFCPAVRDAVQQTWKSALRRLRLRRAAIQSGVIL
jgi:hypothetical protein